MEEAEAALPAPATEPPGGAQPRPGGIQSRRDHVLSAIEKANKTIAALCDGSERWTMRIPAQPDRDPDLVISTALHLAEKFIQATPEPSHRSETPKGGG